MRQVSRSPLSLAGCEVVEESLVAVLRLRTASDDVSKS